MQKVIRRAVLLIFALLCTALVLSASHTARTAAQNKNVPRKAADVSTLYANNCARCHGKDGRSKSLRGKLLSARDLSDPEWQASVSDEHLFNSIMNGRGKMPSFGKKLSEAQINSLVEYVRRLKK